MANQLIPSQAIDLRTPNPSASANLSIPSSNGFVYSSEWQGWQLVVKGAAVNFSLTLPKPQAIQLSFVMCSMAYNRQTNNPITLTVNSYQLFTKFDPHRQTFVTFTFYIPGHWLNTGANVLKLSLDGNASTMATFWSVNVTGIAPQTTQGTSINFETPNPVATNILSIVEQKGTLFDSRFNAWQIKAAGKYISYNLYLDQPRLVALSMNFCSMASGGHSNNPLNITVNGKTLVKNYDPHILTFHDEQWLVPENWVVTGNNKITVTLAGSASTTLDYKSFGAAVQVLPPRASSVTLSHNNEQIEAN